MTANALEYIRREHDEVDGLFDQISDPQADRGEALKRLEEKMAAHISVERSILGPVIEQHDLGGKDLQESLTEEHKNMERLLVLIERRKVNSPDLPDLATELLDTWREHCEQVADRLVPALEQALPADELERLGEEMDAGENVIISHPHPHLLSAGPLSRITTRLAARFDRMRDRTVTNR